MCEGCLYSNIFDVRSGGIIESESIKHFGWSCDLWKPRSDRRFVNFCSSLLNEVILSYVLLIFLDFWIWFGGVVSCFICVCFGGLLIWKRRNDERWWWRRGRDSSSGGATTAARVEIFSGIWWTHCWWRSSGR